MVPSAVRVSDRSLNHGASDYRQIVRECYLAGAQDMVLYFRHDGPPGPASPVARHLIRKEPTVITSTTRRERHEINIRLEVTGEQVITDRDALITKRPITPTVVQLSYHKQGGEWARRALVYGTQAGSLLNGWAEYYERAEGGTDWWPAWLLAYSQQFDPSREAATGMKGQR